MDRVARFCADAQCPQPDKEGAHLPPQGCGKECWPSCGARLPQRGREDNGQHPPGSSVESRRERWPVRLLA